MNIDNLQSQRGTEEERAVAFCVAAYEAYTAIKSAKRMVRAGRTRPKTLLRHLEDIEAHLDTIYAEARLRQTALNDMTQFAQELLWAHDQLLIDTKTAYEDGWRDALKEVIPNAPGDDGIVVRWLIETLASDSAWRAPEWDKVIELMKEARRYLTAHHAE